MFFKRGTFNLPDDDKGAVESHLVIRYIEHEVQWDLLDRDILPDGVCDKNK
jgi:hypothetical protein